MADTFVRSYNPIWDFRSLTGKPLDDNSWAYFLENEIPYAPQSVFKSADGTEWSNPVQLSAAGTLENIFFDPDKVYRIEIRTNDGTSSPSSSDELVWLIENYVPNGTSDTPQPTSGNLASDNQITNPQFSLINFSSPFSLSNVNAADVSPISVAPGWDLVLTGTGGDVTLTQVALSDSDTTTSNAPYALRLDISGWTTAYLRQKFDQAGMLWANKFVSGALTASITDALQDITGVLHDSSGTELGTVIDTQLSNSLEQYLGVVELPASTNSDTPPDASIEYRINLPGTSNIQVTSIQLLSTDQSLTMGYEQETVERQIDHTYHVNRDNILFQSKENLLTGWDFPLNPWQFHDTALTNLSGTGDYTADQTIVITEESDAVKVGRASDPLGYFQVQSRVGQTQGKLALVQYIDPATLVLSEDTILSSLAQLQFSTSDGTTLKIKMRLIWSDTLPSAVDPISGWGSTDPVFKGQWNELKPENDPEYTISSDTQSFQFNKFSVPANTNDTATVGIVLYTITDLSSAAADDIFVKNISLVKNDKATEATPLTFDETLRRCQYYYEKSYQLDDLPGTVTTVGVKSVAAALVYRDSPARVEMARKPFYFDYATVKRTDTPSFTFYSPTVSTEDRIQIVLYNQTSPIQSDIVNISGYTQLGVSSKNVSYLVNNNASLGAPSATPQDYGLTNFHYVCDARLGK